MAAASSLLTPSLIGLGAPSTRSLASFKPRLVTSRTALMTLILLAPTSVRTTENSVFSSTGAAPGAAPPPATITGAAAAGDTPKASSIFLTKSAASSSVSPLISSRIDSTLLAIASFSSSLVCELFCLDRFLHNHGQISIERCERGRAAPRGRLQQEHDLADQLFLGRQKSQLLNFRDGQDASFDHACLETKSGHVLGNLGEYLGQRNRVGAVSDRVCSGETLEQILGRGSRTRTFGERILDDLILSARTLHGATKLRILSHGDALKGGENHRGDLGQVAFQLFDFFVFLAAFFHLDRSRKSGGGGHGRFRFGQVNGNAGAHGGTQGDLLDVTALGRRRLGLDHRGEQSLRIFGQFGGIKTLLADRRMDDAGLIHAKLD